MFQKIYCCLLFILTASMAYSQCTESLGTPIINETFGSGTSQFGPALPSGTTNMQYIENACPEDGYYSIVNYTSLCFGEWHTLTDHTGDKNGYFMVIDASFQPSDFFVQTVNGLCDGTTYKFAAWIINMFQISGGINPNITFTIEKTDGTILSTYNSGDIDVTLPATWQQYGLYFQTPVGVSTVVLRMHNNAPGGQGNDLGLDDITFTPSGPKTTVGINGISGNNATILCNNKTILSSTVGSCYIKNSYQWQISTDGTNYNNIPGATNASYTVNLPATGSYQYRLNVAESGNIGNASCSANSNIFNIIYAPPSIANISTSICSGSSYLLPSGKTVSTAGLHTDTLLNSQGCDSLITQLDLTVKPGSFSTVTASICQGQTYSGHTKTGVYTDTLTAANGCDSIRTVNLIVFDFNTPNLDTNKLLCIGDSIILNPGIFNSYLWQDNSAKPYFKVTTGGTYWVKVTDENGCTASDTIVIREEGCLPAKIPNTFTPNGDGINDTWNIDGLKYYPACTVFIYSRWGQLVFKSTGYGKPWDGQYNGRNLSAGTYYYIINLKNNTPPISGYVTIIR
jgi:gliding motility-associated-like protein